MPFHDYVSLITHSCTHFYAHTIHSYLKRSYIFKFISTGSGCRAICSTNNQKPMEMKETRERERVRRKRAGQPTIKCCHMDRCSAVHLISALVYIWNVLASLSAPVRSSISLNYSNCLAFGWRTLLLPVGMSRSVSCAIDVVYVIIIIIINVRVCKKAWNW